MTKGRRYPVVPGYDNDGPSKERRLLLTPGSVPHAYEVVTQPNNTGFLISFLYAYPTKEETDDLKHGAIVIKLGRNSRRIFAIELQTPEGLASDSRAIELVKKLAQECIAILEKLSAEEDRQGVLMNYKRVESCLHVPEKSSASFPLWMEDALKELRERQSPNLH